VAAVGQSLLGWGWPLGQQVLEELVVVAVVVAAAVARVVAALVLLVRAPVAVWYWLQR